MITKFESFVKSSRLFASQWQEAVRIVVSLAVIAICFWPDFAAMQTTLFVLGVFFAIALISHLVRKYALFPYLNMKRYAAKALETPLAASIVFASVCAVIVVSISTTAAFFAK